MHYLGLLNFGSLRVLSQTYIDVARDLSRYVVTWFEKGERRFKMDTQARIVDIL